MQIEACIQEADNEHYIETKDEVLQNPKLDCRPHPPLIRLKVNIQISQTIFLFCFLF